MIIVKNYIGGCALVVDIDAREYTFYNVDSCDYEYVKLLIRKKFYGKAIQFLKKGHSIKELR